MFVENHTIVAALAVIGIALAAGARATQAPPAAPPFFASSDLAGPASPLTALRAPRGLDPDEIELGRLLFFDTRLSKDWKVSCATCHPPAQAGADGRPRSLGVGGLEGSANAPTVYNSGLNPWQFWDGRAASLEAQIDGPLLDTRELGSSWALAIARINIEEDLVRRFRDIYGGPPTRSRVQRAIATYERSLVSVDSPFDRYLQGDTHALSAEAERGYELFVSYGCASCHQGANVGGNMLQVVGVVGDLFAARGRPETRADQGRFNVTGLEEDRHVFRVPSVRLAALTAPYFHDGSVASLDEAIRIMGRYQLGRDLSAEDRTAIASFIGSLAGDLEQGEDHAP